MESKFVFEWLNEYYKISTLKIKPLNKSSISLNTIEVAKILLSLKSKTN